ncbi:MAG: hypothetical protein J7L25_06920 [Deltaproteobacteria bacterium]|nr:hypothetical protein [Candidatus Tharpella aukensis]
MKIKNISDLLLKIGYKKQVFFSLPPVRVVHSRRKGAEKNQKITWLFELFASLRFCDFAETFGLRAKSASGN